MKQAALVMSIDCLGIPTVVIVATMFGLSLILGALFGLAYRIDGYGGCRGNNVS